jgi:hypothetical protein
MRTSLHLSFWFNYLVLWVILVVYTSIDVIIWPAYQSAGIPINLYDKLWFSFNYGLMAVAAIAMLSVAIPVLIWLFNRLMVESLFYYILQHKLPPHNLPWLSLGTSTNLYLVSIAFILLSMALIYVELRWKRKLLIKRLVDSNADSKMLFLSYEALKEEGNK